MKQDSELQFVQLYWKHRAISWSISRWELRFFSSAKTGEQCWMTDELTALFLKTKKKKENKNTSNRGSLRRSSLKRGQKCSEQHMNQSLTCISGPASSSPARWVRSAPRASFVFFLVFFVCWRSAPRASFVFFSFFRLLARRSSRLRSSGQTAVWKLSCWDGAS